MESKILDTIKYLYKDLEGNWWGKLEEINIFYDVRELYFVSEWEVGTPEKPIENPRLIEKRRFNSSHKVSNTILAYIVFAYHQNSQWLDLHADRIDNKNKIMMSLAGKDYQDNPDFCDAIIGLDEPYNSVIEWFLNSQMDKRWKQILTDYEYHSRAQNIAGYASGAKEMAEVGKMLTAAENRRNRADELLEVLKNENVKIDSALQKEHREPLTERQSDNFMSWETFISNRNKERKGDLATDYNDGLSDYEEVQ